MVERSSLTEPIQPLKLFVSYSHKDKVLRDKLESHLILLKREGIVELWTDQSILAGQEWGKEIDRQLNTSDVILLLISADFLASEYCYTTEMQQALKRHETGDALVIPIILRPVEWKNAPFGHLQALPFEGKAVTLWPNRDLAMVAVASKLRIALEQFAEALASRRWEQVGDITVVTLEGRLTLGARATETLTNLIQNVVARGGRKVLIDMHRVSYMDSGGVGALVTAYSEAWRNKITFALCALRPKVNDFIVVTKLAPIFRLYPTRQEALATLSVLKSDIDAR